MRQEKPTLCGRDHISYRSYFLPAKVSMVASRTNSRHSLNGQRFPTLKTLKCVVNSQDVIDGDLCEQFSSLPYDKQKLVATGLDRTVGEVVKKLEDTRNRLL